MFSERHGATRWGSKSRSYVLHHTSTVAMFPDAQVISIVRDPRSVIASMRKLGWLEEWYDGTVVGGLDLWVRSVRSGEHAVKHYRADQFLQFRYEDLIEDPPATLKEICAFTSLSDRRLGTMLAFHETDAGIPDHPKAIYHPMIDQPFTKHEREHWMSQLSDEEVAFIERAATAEMERYGYELRRTDVKVPADLERRWAEIQRRNWRRGLKGRSKRSPTYRYPVAASLTTAQRRRESLLKVGRRRRSSEGVRA